MPLLRDSSSTIRRHVEEFGWEELSRLLGLRDAAPGEALSMTLTCEGAGFRLAAIYVSTEHEGDPGGIAPVEFA